MEKADSHQFLGFPIWYLNVEMPLNRYHQLHRIKAHWFMSSASSWTQMSANMMLRCATQQVKALKPVTRRLHRQDDTCDINYYYKYI